MGYASAAAPTAFSEERLRSRFELCRAELLPESLELLLDAGGDGASLASQEAFRGQQCTRRLRGNGACQVPRLFHEGNILDDPIHDPHLEPGRGTERLPEQEQLG